MNDGSHLTSLRGRDLYIALRWLAVYHPAKYFSGRRCPFKKGSNGMMQYTSKMQCKSRFCHSHDPSKGHGINLFQRRELLMHLSRVMECRLPKPKPARASFLYTYTVKYSDTDELTLSQKHPIQVFFFCPRHIPCRKFWPGWESH